MTIDWTEVDKIARQNPVIEMPEQKMHPIVTIEYIDDLDSDTFYKCICGACSSIGANYCSKCGRRLIWRKKQIDPRTKITCLFCNKNNIDRPVMATRGVLCICSDCVRNIYYKIFEDSHLPSMKVTGNIDMRDEDD